MFRAFSSAELQKSAREFSHRLNLSNFLKSVRFFHIFWPSHNIKTLLTFILAFPAGTRSTKVRDGLSKLLVSIGFLRYFPNFVAFSQHLNFRELTFDLYHFVWRRQSP